MQAIAKSVEPEALQKTAKLFRVFGEDYHEQKLEEAHIFPLLARKMPEFRAGRNAAELAEPLGFTKVSNGSLRKQTCSARSRLRRSR